MKSSKVSWCVFWIWDPRSFHNSFFVKNNLISIISALFKNEKKSSSYKGLQTTYKIMKMFDIARDIRDFFSFFIWKTLHFVEKVVWKDLHLYCSFLRCRSFETWSWIINTHLELHWSCRHGKKICISQRYTQNLKRIVRTHFVSELAILLYL